MFYAHEFSVRFNVYLLTGQIINLRHAKSISSRLSGADVATSLEPSLKSMTRIFPPLLKDGE